MPYSTNDLEGTQALDQNQLARRLQFSVAEGCAVSPGTNDLTVEVEAGEVIFDGASVSVSAQDNVALASPDSADPRKDVVYVDGNGDAQIATGTPEPAQPAGQIRRDTYRPAPPDLAAMNAVVLAEVWISAQTTDVAAADIFDRRLFADAAFRNVESESLSTDESVTVTTGEATDTLHYGSDQDRPNAGNNSVAIGIGARANGDDGSGGTIGNHTAIGYQAAQNNTGNNVTATGYQAARNNTGANVTATGHWAAQNNTGNQVTASGHWAAQNNTGAQVTASGRAAAQDNTGLGVTASGYLAAQNNTGNQVTASGYQAARGDGLADPTTMGDDNIGIGDSAIRNNQASGLIAIGQDAGINAQTDDQLIITQRDGTRRMVMDLTTGDLSITGSLNENATL
ncbi:hypothetical protein [Halobellus rufus]|uniref:hypothetical protein n=1 Tax=Halobellus rufus TaxID=1448860 RepID=UPI0006790386|nr:hypothetical protein [Halobellus rufus]